MVAAIRDDPAQRMNLAASFYDDRPGRPPIQSYRRAELAFMHWQVSRGVLAPPGAERPGSQWWRSVNEGLLRDAWEALTNAIAALTGTRNRRLPLTKTIKVF